MPYRYVVDGHPFHGSLADDLSSLGADLDRHNRHRWETRFPIGSTSIVHYRYDDPQVSRLFACIGPELAGIMISLWLVFAAPWFVLPDGDRKWPWQRMMVVVCQLGSMLAILWAFEHYNLSVDVSGRSEGKFYFGNGAISLWLGAAVALAYLAHRCRHAWRLWQERKTPQSP